MNKQERIIGITTLFIIAILFIIALLDSWQSVFWFIAFLITLVVCSYQTGRRQQIEEINMKLSSTIEEISKSQGGLLLQNDILYGMLPRDKGGDATTSDDNDDSKRDKTD